MSINNQLGAPMTSQDGDVPLNYDVDPESLTSERLDFHFERVQLQFDLKNQLTRLHVANNIMYILTSLLVYRIDLDNPSDVSRVPAPAVSESTKITNSWVHPNGKYLMIQVNKTQYFVLHMSYRKFKVLPRFKGLDVRDIAFSGKSSDEYTSGDFLCVTTDGSVYVALLKHHDPATQDNKRDDKYAKQLFNAKAPATGIAYSHKFRQIQLFLQSEMLVWDCVELVLDEITQSLRQHPISTQIPDGSGGALILALDDCYYYFAPALNEFVSSDEEAAFADTNKLDVDNVEMSGLPNSVFMTPHHFTHLSADQKYVYVFDKLMSQGAFKKNVPEIQQDEKILGLAVDYLAETYWLYTSNSIHEILFSNEQASVWYSYYKLGKYTKALEVLNCAKNSPENWFKKNVVMVKNGYDLLQRGGFGMECSQELSQEELDRFELQREGVKVLAQLQEQFEKVCLLLLNNEQSATAKILSNKLLIDYLSIKFSLAKEAKNKVQQVALSSWIVKLHLHLMYVIKHDFLNVSEILTSSDPSESKNFWQRQHDEIDDGLMDYLSRNHKFLDQKTIYQLMRESQFYDKLISYAELLQDYEYIVDYNVDFEDWLAALKALAKLYSRDPEVGKAFIYKTSEVLLVNNARLTVDTWLRFPELNYEKLLPAILRYNKGTSYIPFSQNYSVMFLQRLVLDKGIKNSDINNYLLSLLISYPNEDDSLETEKALNKVLEYLQSNHAGYNRGLPYDKDFLLRLSLQFKRYKCAILILINMGLYEVSLKLALEHGLTSLGEYVLRDYVKNSSEDEESQDNFMIETTSAEDSKIVGKIKLEEDSFAYRRKLWLIYAKYLVDKVCNGEKLDIPGLPSETTNQFANKNGPVNSKNGVLSSQSPDVSKEAGIDIDLQNSRLYQTLHYLLHLSYSRDQNSSVLTLKDLLPLFPESIKIIHFREEIVESLNFYNTKINQLGLEMQDSASTAQKLKKQIEQNQKKEVKGSIYTIIEPGEACQLCSKLLVDKNFLIFPNCHHGFHKDCTVRFYLKLKGDYRFKKIFQNFKKTSSLDDKTELDKLLQSECLLCNDSLLNKLEDPLIDLDKERQEWEV